MAPTKIHEDLQTEELMVSATKGKCMIAGKEVLARAQRKLQKMPRIILLRRTVQFLVVVMLLAAAWHFYQFVEYLKYDNIGAAPLRPPVAEAFLPIAAIVAFKAYTVTGQIDPIHPAGLVIFIATIVTAWIFRRALCSWICPLGAASEQLGNLGKRLFGRNLAVPRWLDMVLISLKYVLTFYLMKMLLFMPASAAIDFMNIPYYSISDIKMFELFTNLSTTGFVIIGTLLALSVMIRSFWCRYLCPYGALLGIIGFISPVILTKNNETCISCGLCNKACPNRVDVESKRSVVVSAECTGCASCVSVCPTKNTLEFKLFGVLPIDPLAYCLGFLAIFFGIVLVAQVTGHWETSLTLEQYRVFLRAMSGGAGGF